MFRGLRIITGRQRSYLKVIFLQACVYSQGGSGITGPGSLPGCWTSLVPCPTAGWVIEGGGG